MKLSKKNAKIYLFCHLHRHCCPPAFPFLFPLQILNLNKRHGVLLPVHEDFDGLSQWNQLMSYGYAFGLVTFRFLCLYHRQICEVVLGIAFQPNFQKQP